ncbi:MAG: hypothetical protein FWC64_05120 [Treponema sp.]|nr:hypothetical protein [Treponema sp.]
MKKIVTVAIAVFALALSGCQNTLLEIPAGNDAWQRFTGSSGIGFWGWGNNPDEPQALLVFVRTSLVTRIEYWEGRELLRSAEWLDSTGDTITYRAPNGQIIIQHYFIFDNGLELDELNVSLTSGGIFWRRERPSWWSWEFPSQPPNLSGSSHNFTGSSGIGFWGGGGNDPNNPEAVFVFINTSSVSRVEFWVNQELRSWGHWIDATGNTIITRRHDFLNPATQRYYVDNNRLWLVDHFAAIARGGPFYRIEGPQWWELAER